jgi:hypothetical protein
MKLNNSFAAIVTLALTAGINVAAIAAPVNSKAIKEMKIQNTQIETIQQQNNTNTKSEKATKPSQGQENSQGNKCRRFPYGC